MGGTEFWVAAVLASVAVGLSKGGLPVVAMMSVPILSLVMPPLQAAGLLLPIYIVSDWFGVWAYRRAYDLRVLKIMFPATAIGIGLGWATANLISEAMVGGLIGALGSSFAASRLLGGGGKCWRARTACCAGADLGHGGGVHQLCQPCRWPALSDLRRAAADAKGGVCWYVDHFVHMGEYGQTAGLCFCWYFVL